MKHWHASVIENHVYTERKRCFTGEWVESLTAAASWLSGEIRADSHVYIGQSERLEQFKAAAELEKKYEEALRDCTAWPGGEAWQTEILVQRWPNILMGYRIHSVDGDCEEMI